MTSTAIRELRPADAAEALALVVEQFGGTPYEPRLRELLGLAIRDDGGGEHQGAVAVVEGAIRGLAVHGAIAGSQAGKIHAVIGRDPRLGAGLLEAVRERHVRAGAALLVCELPGEPAFATASEALAIAGFAVEGTIAGFVRDGVALRLFVRRW